MKNVGGTPLRLSAGRQGLPIGRPMWAASTSLVLERKKGTAPFLSGRKEKSLFILMEGKAS
jgi:hypothetical protein